MTTTAEPAKGSCIPLDSGTRITVYWPSHDQWYKGTVADKDDNNGSVFVEYDDGDTGWVDIAADKWRLSTKPDKYIMKDTLASALKEETIAKLEISDRISVWWPEEQEYYTGTLLAKTSSNNDSNGEDSESDSYPSQPHHIRYDDGDEEWTNLLHRKFRRVHPKVDRLKVGSRVSIFSKEDKCRFPATVIKIKLKRARPHRVQYDNKDIKKEWLNLNVTPFLVITETDAVPSNATESMKVNAYTLKKRKQEFLKIPEQPNPKTKKVKVEEENTQAPSSAPPCQAVCGICRSLAKRPRATSCHHLFCKRCIEDHVSRQADTTCPLCKVGVSKKLVKYNPEHVSFQAVEALERTTANVAMSFSSASAASLHESTHFVPSLIVTACESKRRDDREYQGYYWRFQGSKDRILRVGESIREGVAVEQVDLTTGNIIEVFVSSRKAAEKTGVSRCALKRVLERRGKATAGGFFWRFQGEMHGPWPDPEPTNLNPAF